MIFKSNFFRRKAPVLARDLLGSILVTEVDGLRTSGRIVEVEAYRQDEPASHCYGGKTERNKSMFLPGGHLYVYLSYGIHYCANIIAGVEGYGEAVLIRGIEPIEHIEIMRERRGNRVRNRDLANGPGKLTQALGINLSHDGIDLLSTTGPVHLLPGEPVPDSQVRQTPRIGITKAIELPWRWVMSSQKNK